MFELVPNASVEVQISDGKLNVQRDAEGRFQIQVPNEPLSVKISGKNIEPQTRIFSTQDTIQNVQIKIKYIVSPVNENVTIQAKTLSPEIERRAAASSSTARRTRPATMWSISRFQNVSKNGLTLIFRSIICSTKNTLKRRIISNRASARPVLFCQEFTPRQVIRQPSALV